MTGRIPVRGPSPAQRYWGHRHSPAASRAAATVAALSQAHSALVRGAEEVLAPYGISYSHCELLSVLLGSSSATQPMSALSAALGVAPASLTHTVSRLESQGIVQRHINELDRRSVLVAMTDQGIVLADAALGALARYFEEMPMTASEQEAVITATETVRRQ